MLSKIFLEYVLRLKGCEVVTHRPRFEPSGPKIPHGVANPIRAKLVIPTYGGGDENLTIPSDHGDDTAQNDLIYNGQDQSPLRAISAKYECFGR